MYSGYFERRWRANFPAMYPTPETTIRLIKVYGKIEFGWVALAQRMLKSSVRRIGVQKLADPQLLQFAQSGKLLCVNDGDDGRRKCHGSMNAEIVKHAH